MTESVLLHFLHFCIAGIIQPQIRKRSWRKQYGMVQNIFRIAFHHMYIRMERQMELSDWQADKDQQGDQKMKRVITAVLLASLLAGCVTKKNIRFGTADEGGIYYTFGTLLSEAMNEKNKKYTLQVKETAGSASNVRLLSEGYIQVGVAQSDVVNEMYYGEELTGNKENKYQGYSAVASLWTEDVQIAVLKNSDIENLNDLEDKTVSIGQEESGTERNARQVLSAVGLQDGNINMENYDYSDAMSHLLDGSIDAMFVTAGAPVQIYADNASSIRLLSLSDDEIERICKTFDGYVKTAVPSGVYGAREDVNTIGVKAVLLASDEAPDNAVYEMCQVLFADMSTIEDKLGVDENITAETAADGVTIPFHAGAEKWYKKNGISDGGND